MGLYLLVAARNLLQARRRTAILSLALVLVTVLLVVLLAISQGLTDNMVRSATTLAAGHVNVGGFYKTTPSDAVPVVLDAPRVRRVVEAATPGLAFVIDRQRGLSKMVSDTGSQYCALVGIDAAQERRLAETLTLAEEADYRDGGSSERKGTLARLGEPGTVVLFAAQAKRLGVVPGDPVTIVSESMKGAANSREVTVAGVAEDIGLLSVFSVLVSQADVRELMQLRDDTTGAVMVYLDDIEASDRVLGVLRTALEREGFELLDHEAKPFMQKLDDVAGEDWTGQRLDLTIWQDEVSFLSWVVKAFDGVASVLVAILCAIIALGIMNTMWMSVRERTGEIGTLRAIGMGKGQILALFLTEALLLGAVATTTGGLLGGALSLAVDAARIKLPFDAAKVVLLSDVLHLALRPGQIALAIVALTAVTGLAALWPALRAASLRPVTAMQL